MRDASPVCSIWQTVLGETKLHKQAPLGHTAAVAAAPEFHIQSHQAGSKLITDATFNPHPIHNSPAF